MSQTLAVDSNNDIYLNAENNLAIATGLQAVSQNCEHAMKTLLGECVLDLPRGIPNFETVWNGRPNLAQYNLASVLALQAVEGVVKVPAFESVKVGDALQYTATIQTIYGGVTL